METMQHADATPGGNGIAGIDHLLIAVRDLDRARDVYQRLGFTVTPRGRHTELKSANHTIMFAAGDYLELFAVEEPHPVTAAYSAFLRSREGVAAAALKTDDAGTAYARLTAAGIGAGQPVAFGRPVALPDGERQARFTILPLEPGTMPGGGAFLCQHHTRDLVWRPEHVEHANGAMGLDALVVAADDVAGTAAAYARLFASAVETHGAVRVVPAAGARVVVAPPATLSWAWTADPLLDAARPFLAGAVIRVRDLYAAQRVLQDSRFPVVAGNGVLRVGSASAAGAMLAFAERFDLAALVP